MTRQHFGVQVHTSGSAPARRDRRVSTKNVVACPTCGAEVGESCVTTDGNAVRTSHTTRRRMAIRANNEQVDLDALRRIRVVGSGARKAVRKQDGATLTTLAAEFGTSHQTLLRWERGLQPVGEAGSRYAAWVLERLP